MILIIIILNSNNNGKINNSDNNFNNNGNNDYLNDNENNNDESKLTIKSNLVCFTLKQHRQNIFLRKYQSAVPFLGRSTFSPQSSSISSGKCETGQNRIG